MVVFLGLESGVMFLRGGVRDPALLRTNKLTVIYTSVGDAAPYKQFVDSSQFFTMQWGQVSAGSGDPALLRGYG